VNKLTISTVLIKKGKIFQKISDLKFSGKFSSLLALNSGCGKFYEGGPRVAPTACEVVSDCRKFEKTLPCGIYHQGGPTGPASGQSCIHQQYHSWRDVCSQLAL
jgi:hypothetical protein